MTESPESSQSIGPFIESPTASFPPDLRHLDPIVYGDIFDYPLTLDEIWRYCPLPFTREQLVRRLDGSESTNAAAALLGSRDGFYYLQGREELVDRRRRREDVSRTIWKRARKVAGLIQHVPFIRALAVTGSLTTDNTEEDGDPDFLVITESNRIWTVFFFLGTIQKLTSTRTLCPNFYISSESLGVTPRDYYNAREVTQAIPLVGMELFQRFIEANSWVRDYIPNFNGTAHRESGPLPCSGPLRPVGRFIERLARGGLGDRLERFFRRLLFHRLTSHYRTFGGQAPEEVLAAARQGRELRFHGLHHRTLIQEAIDQRVERLRQKLSSLRLTG